MISLIVCSINAERFSNFSENVEKTIGVEFQIVKIDNTSNKYSICEAYNEGAKLSSFPYLCFVHEDVEFSTPEWGRSVVEVLDDPAVGIIGVAGSSFKSSVPSSWFVDPKYCYKNIVQGYKYSIAPRYHDFLNPTLDKTPEAVVLDGVFLGTRKEVWNKCRFDEDHFPGFHGYDIDFCLQVGHSLKLKILVVYNLLLTHFSEGRPDKNWLESAKIISKKWKGVLPISIKGLSFSEEKTLHWACINQMIFRSLHNRIGFFRTLTLTFRYALGKYFVLIPFLKCIKKILVAEVRFLLVK